MEVRVGRKDGMALLGFRIPEREGLVRTVHACANIFKLAHALRVYDVILKRHGVCLVFSIKIRSPVQT